MLSYKIDGSSCLDSSSRQAHLGQHSEQTVQWTIYSEQHEDYDEKNEAAQ